MFITRPIWTPTAYRNAPPLKLPWHSRFRDFELTNAEFSCGCGNRLVDVRGYIDETEEGKLIRLAAAGICRRCNHIVTVTMMISPERDSALVYKGGDRWRVVRVERQPSELVRRVLAAGFVF